MSSTELPSFKAFESLWVSDMKTICEDGGNIAAKVKAQDVSELESVTDPMGADPGRSSYLGLYLLNVPFPQLAGCMQLLFSLS